MREFIVAATEDHALSLAKRLRLSDKRELWYASRKRPEKALLQAVRRSGPVWSWIHDGAVQAMFGITSRGIIGRSGCPWMLASNVVDENPLMVARVSKDFIRNFKERYDRLENQVWAGHTKAILWLKWLGFAFDDKASYGPYNKDFYRFYWTRNKGNV